MKKLISFLVIALLISSNAFAFVCSSSQKAGAADECYVQVKNGTTSDISAYTVVMYDFSQDTPAEAAFNVKPATPATASGYIAGVPQQTIVSGQTGTVLVRGVGQVKVTGTVTSGLALYHGSVTGLLTGNKPDHSSQQKAFALEGGTNTTVDAYITVV